METIRIGGLLLEFLHSKDDTAGSLDMFRMTVQPNTRMPVPHYHESWDEVAYGLDGTLTFQVDGRDVPIGPGQSVFIRRGVVHGFRNDTQEPAVCLSVLSPRGAGPRLFPRGRRPRRRWSPRPGADEGGHAALRAGAGRARRLIGRPMAERATGRSPACALFTFGNAM